MTQESAFEHILGEKVILGKKYCNPFRNDKSPSCFFTKKGKWLRFNDPAFNEFSGMHYVDFVYYHVNGRRTQNKEEFIEGLKLMNNLGLGGIKPYATNITTQQQTFRATIKFTPKDFTKKDVWYWGQFGIHTEHLKTDCVYSVKSFKYNRRQSPDEFKEVIPTCLSFAITRGDRVKIYQPYSNFKWLGNFDHNDIFEWDGFGKTLIFGSYKDARVSANLGFKTMAAAYETKLPDKVPDDSILIGDFDEPGNNYKKGFDGDKRIFYTNLPVKDLAEIRHHYGENFTKQFLINLAYGHV